MSGYLEGVMVLLAVNVVFAYGGFLPLAAGQLVSLLPGHEPPRVTVSAVYARSKTLAPRVRVLVDYLRQQFSAAAWAEK